MDGAYVLGTRNQAGALLVAGICLGICGVYLDNRPYNTRHLVRLRGIHCQQHLSYDNMTQDRSWRLRHWNVLNDSESSTLKLYELCD